MKTPSWLVFASIVGLYVTGVRAWQPEPEPAPTSVATFTSPFSAGGGNPPFKITTHRDNDRVAVKFEKAKVIFSVHSPFGISNTTIEEAGEKWPDAVVMRLHLKGLENFKVTNGKVKLEGSASLQDGKSVVRLWKDGREDMQLDAISPYWMEVRILDRDGKQAQEIPLKDGYFEMQLPKALFEGNRKITVEWIDFYRG